MTLLLMAWRRPRQDPEMGRGARLGPARPNGHPLHGGRRKTCPGCGGDIDYEFNRFCPKCGARLGGSR